MENSTNQILENIKEVIELQSEIDNILDQLTILLDKSKEIW